MNIDWPVAVIVIVVAIALVFVFAVMRHRVKSANIKGYGVSAGIEGTEHQKPVPNQEWQVHDSTVKRSSFKLFKGSRASIFRSKVKRTDVQIISDDGTGGNGGAQVPPGTN